MDDISDVLANKETYNKLSWLKRWKPFPEKNLHIIT